MFNGVPQEQFHQFKVSSRTISPFPINPLSFPLHASSPNTTFPTSTSTFDPYPSHLLHQLHQQPVSLNKDEEEKDQKATNSTLLPEQIVDLWSNDEVLSLLRIRSSMENWFPDLTWEHVSRKLAEFGFKRSAEKCREKFEEETGNLNSISFNKNRFSFSELEELYHGEKTQKQNQDEDEDEDPATNATLVANNDNPSELQSEEIVKNTSTKTNRKKRKREKFEMFKGFCIDIVNKMIAQQEQMHNKLLEDMVNRDEEKIAREEAWKKKEMESFNKEIEIRAHEQAIASSRQATIIEYLKKFATNSSDKHFGTSLSYENLLEISNNLSPSNLSSTSTKSLVSQNQNLSNFEKNPSPIPPSRTQKAQKNNNSAMNDKDDIGKRWPKDEVLALINMRCSLYNNINDHQDKEGLKGSSMYTPWVFIILALFIILVGKIEAKVPAIIVFGDSSVDAGNNNQIPTIARSNFEPYGRDFPGGKATGRFSNGRVPTDFISEAFGLKPTVPAYLDPTYKISDFAVGVTFASAGSGYDSATSDVLSVISLSKELEYYKEYQKKLRAYLGAAKANKTISEALYLMSLGTNDFLENYYTMPNRRSQFTIDKYQDFLVGIAKNFVTNLYGLGARKISVGGIPPMGCMPLERTTNMENGCVESYNIVALNFNQKLSGLVTKLNRQLPGIQVVFSNPYSVFLQMVQKPSSYGFEVGGTACCATGMFEMGYACSRFSALTCQDANKYVFWDAIHPSERASRIISDHLVKTVLHKFL